MRFHHLDANSLGPIVGNFRPPPRIIIYTSLERGPMHVDENGRVIDKCWRARKAEERPRVRATNKAFIIV